MPDKDNLKLLVNALRSGEYKKAKGKLRIRDCFCVKGVACELYRLNTGIGKWEGSIEQDFVTTDDELSWDNDIEWPGTVAKWYGVQRNFKIKLPEYGDDEFKGKIEYLNDDLDLSFNEIADIIERNFLLESENDTGCAGTVPEGN